MSASILTSANPKLQSLRENKSGVAAVAGNQRQPPAQCRDHEYGPLRTRETELARSENVLRSVFGAVGKVSGIAQTGNNVAVGVYFRVYRADPYGGFVGWEMLGYIVNSLLRRYD